MEKHGSNLRGLQLSTHTRDAGRGAARDKVTLGAVVAEHGDVGVKARERGALALGDARRNDAAAAKTKNA
jgi:hypothetical protein